MPFNTDPAWPLVALYKVMTREGLTPDEMRALACIFAEDVISDQNLARRAPGALIPERFVATRAGLHMLNGEGERLMRELADAMGEPLPVPTRLAS